MSSFSSGGSSNLDCVTSYPHADKLDGLKVSGKRKREDVAGLDDYLQLPDDYATRTSQPGKKRVKASAARRQRGGSKAPSTGAMLQRTTVNLSPVQFFAKYKLYFQSFDRAQVQGGVTPPRPPVVTLCPVRCPALRFAGPTWRSRRTPIESALSALWSAKRTGRG